jgi:Fe-S-cluster containining protein
MSPVFCLSTHAPYRCQHSGACCTAGWHIPAEPPVVSAIEIHFGPDANQRLIRARRSSTGEPAILSTGPDGACTFFDTAGGRLCAIHRDLGEHLLPSACRQFPRVTLRDPRGTWITLSHFCPTAANLLFVPSPLRIVPAPDAISLSGQAEGLDATNALPPLLRPAMLMDFKGYGEWEACAVELLGAGGPSVNGALAALDLATREIREWCPGRRPLNDVVKQAMQSMPASSAAEKPGEDSRRYSLAVAAVPAGLALPWDGSRIHSNHRDVATLWQEFDDVIRRYLASKLFANWWPYLGLELLSVVDAIRVHAAVLRTSLARHLEHGNTERQAMLEAIRDTDLLMVHLSDSRVLARLIARQS